jgi:predicted MFS family arabinose efflux permease
MKFPTTRLGRNALFFGLYACEGAPIGLIWWTLPTEMRTRGVAVADITALTALLVLPWALKFLWAPMIDALTTRPRALSWVIASAQLGMLLTLLPLLTLDLAASFSTVRWLLLAHAVCGATQDVGIDALAIRSVPKTELGQLNGWMQAGMLLGRSVFGSGALLLAASVGFPALIAAICVWLVLFGSLALWVEPPADAVASARGPLGPELRRILTLRTTWLGLGIALTAGAAFEAVGALAGVFLIDAGYSQEAIGGLLFLPAVGAMLLGSLVGGVLTDRFDARAATALGVVFVALAVGALALTIEQPLPSLFATYFGLGALTASSYALFMELTSERLAATQFSAFMGATNGCESWSALAVGRMASASGYPVAFAVMAAASLLSLPLLALVRPKVDDPSPDSARSA